MESRPGDELVRDVFAYFGLAAFLAHGLEQSLVTALTTAYGPEGRKLDRHDLDRRFEELTDTSPRVLLGVLSRAGLSADVMPALRDALKDRDRLIHGFFWEHAVDFTTVDGCERMLAELTELQRRFGECTARVEGEVREWAAGHDIDVADRDLIHRAILERGRALSDGEIEELRASR